MALISPHSMKLSNDSVSPPTMLFSLLILSLLLSAQAITCDENPSTYAFTFGNARALVIDDGPVTFFDDVVNIPEISRQRAITANFRDFGPTLLGTNILLVDTPTNRILVDTGSANTPEFPDPLVFGSAGRLIDNLRSAGVQPESIDSVLITHAHADHAGGLALQDGSPAFPNATIFLHREDYEFWTAPEDAIPENMLLPAFLAGTRALYARSILPYQNAGRIVFVEDFDEPLEGVRILPSKGHSTGHYCTEFVSEGERIVYSADVFRSKWDQVQNPEWTLNLDTNRDQGIESRISFLTEMANRRELLISTHESFPGIGFIRTVGPSFDWVPADAVRLGNVTRVCNGNGLNN